MTNRVLQPKGWARPRGYSNGIEATGRLVFVAGQIGWDPSKDVPTFPEGFGAQFDQALANVAAVLAEGGATAGHLVRVTVYVTDKKQYLAEGKAVGEAWRKHFGRNYPTMSLVQVAALLEDQALVEVEATAVVP
jgi:enamine deaminase RidA (YjgF/YER057c/UK114 family)